MIIAIPKPTKQGENRLPTTPEKIRELSALGHRFNIEYGAGAGIGIADDEFASIGTSVRILPAQEIAANADLIYTVKEPNERDLFYQTAKHGVHIFCYFHQITEWQRALLRRLNAVAVPYENIIAKDGSRPLLAPMSEIAAAICFYRGVNHLLSTRGARKLPQDAKMAVLGCLGAGGAAAIELALQNGFEYDNIFGLDCAEKFPPPPSYYEYRAIASTPENIAEVFSQIDIAISAVKAGNGKAPKIITKNTMQRMKPGSFFADMAIDEGGTSETSMPTTHENPTYEINGVTHYCVTNMPAAAAVSATNLLADATFPYLQAIGGAYPLTPKTNWNASPELQELKNAAMFY